MATKVNKAAEKKYSKTKSSGRVTKHPILKAFGIFVCALVMVPATIYAVLKYYVLPNEAEQVNRRPIENVIDDDPSAITGDGSGVDYENPGNTGNTGNSDKGEEIEDVDPNRPSRPDPDADIGLSR